MSWSPSKARSLPPLRPGRGSPLAAARERLTASKASQLHPSSRNPPSFQLGSAASPQSLPGPRSARPHSPDLLRLPTATKRKVASMSDEPNPTRPSKAPRLPPISSKDGLRPLPSSPGPGQATFPSPPFFSLTEQEVKILRRSTSKGSSCKHFRDTTVSRALDSLGRGWDGYLRAKDEAEQQGSTDEFWRHFSLELNTVLSTTHFRPGAISIEAAALAAQGDHTTSVGRLRPEFAAEIRRLRAKSSSSLPDPGLAGPGSASCDSTPVRLPSGSPPVPEPGSRVRQRESPGPVIVSRPKRALPRPDYRIPPLLEGSPEPPPSPNLPPETTSPTPREIYDTTQPRFIQYQCEWGGCKASLHNLETLQRHIRIAHADEARDTLSCRWGFCVTATPGMYESPEDLDGHFETSHLTPLKWRLGDGHKSHGTVARAPWRPTFPRKALGAGPPQVTRLVQ